MKMRFVKLRILTACALTIFSCTSLQAKDKNEKTLSIVATQTFTTLDPHVGYDWLTYTTLHSVCAKLTALTKDLNVVEDLADSIDVTDDGKTLIFSLHKTRKFHDGRDIRARDVVYSLNRMLNPKLQSPGSGLFNHVIGYNDYLSGKTDHISGVKELDEYKVQISLTEPSHSFFYILATNFGCVVPEGFNQKPFELPISGGPVKVEKFEDGDLYFSRFDTKPKAYYFPFKGIVVHAGMTTEDVLTLHLKGEVDAVLDGIAWSAISNIEASINDESYKENAAPSRALTYLALNTQLAPFNNINVRRAINYAINRDSLATILNNAATPTSQIIPPVFPAHDKLMKDNIYDRGQAKKLLEGMDLPLQVELYSVDEPLYRNLIHSISEDLRAVGILVSPHYGSHEQIIEVGVDPSKGQIVFSDGLGWDPDFFDVSNFYFPLLSQSAIGNGGWNWSAFDDPHIEKMARTADSLIGTEKKEIREKLWQQIFMKLGHSAPIIPLYNRLDRVYWVDSENNGTIISTVALPVEVNKSTE